MPGKAHIVNDPEYVSTCGQIVGESLSLVAVCEIELIELSREGFWRLARDTYNRPTTIYKSVRGGATNWCSPLST